MAILFEILSNHFVKLSPLGRIRLCQSRFLRWHIAPLLDHWLLYLPWVCLGSGADLLGNIHTLLSSFLESTSGWCTDLPWLLGTPGDWSEFLDRFLLNSAHLLGPLGALSVGGVARGFILTFLLNLSLALNNIILNIMFLLLCPA